MAEKKFFVDINLQGSDITNLKADTLDITSNLASANTKRIVYWSGQYYYSNGTTWIALGGSGNLPTGGATGDILAKASGTDYDVEWISNYTSTVQHEVKAGVAITKGQAVYVSSADGTNMIVSKASNTSEATSSKTMGLAASSAALNGIIFVITEGLLTGTGGAPLDTSTATEGDPVWLGTDGNLLFGLANKPVAPAHLVFIGIVTRSSATVGEIFVKVQNGFELGELHNVDALNPNNNDGLFYNSSNSLWEHKSIATVLGYTPVGGSGTTNYLSKFTAAGTIGNSALYNTGANTGIGVTSPISLLHISSVNKVVSNTLYTSDYLTVSAESTAPGFNIITASDTVGHRGVFKSTRSRGTLDAPTALVSGDQTMSFVAAGHDGTTNFGTAGITFAVDGTVSTNVVPQAITFATGAGNTRSERMRITSAGNVGINTTNPGAALTVRATAVPSAGETVASFQVSDSSATIGIQNSSNTDNIFIPSLVANQVAGSGQAALNLTGYIPAADDTGTNPIMTFRSALGTFTAASTRPLFDFRNWSTSVMLIGANGNVGIGTIAPSTKLEVNGDVKVSTIANATTDTDKFLVSDSGVIKYRTGSEILSDIAAQGALTVTTTGTSGAATLIGNTLNIPVYNGSLIPDLNGTEIWRGHTFRNNSTTFDSTAGLTLSTTGTNTARSVATTSYAARGIRMGVTASLVATGRYSGIRGGVLLWYVTGGFLYTGEFNISDTATATGTHNFWGLASSTADLVIGNISNSQPSALLNIIAFANDSGDSNLQIMHNDGTGTATKIDLGSSFPSNRTAGAAITTIYSCYLYNAPNSSNVIYRIVNKETGAVAQGTLSTNLPASTVGLNFFGVRTMGTSGGGITNSGQFDVYRLGVYSL